VVFAVFVVFHFMDVSVVIPTWKGKHLLDAYLPSVLKACERYRAESGAQTEIVVVDDAGNDGTPEWLRAIYPQSIRLIEHSKNQGFPAACQTGFQCARFPLVLLLNNDVRLKEDCIAPMRNHFRDTEVFAVTGKILSQKEDRFCNGGKIAEFRRGMWSTYKNYDLVDGCGDGLVLLSFTAIGCFSLFERSRFLDIGGFDPLTAMVEDVDVSYRGWKRGWSIRYEPRSVAYHDASQTMDRRYRHRALDKISRRSRILMHWILLHDPWMFAQHLLSLGIRFLTSWIVLDFRFYWAIGTGLTQLPEISRKRREARRTMNRTDRELQRLLQDFYDTAPIRFIKV
jgi:GT2 family glycosyltransferase